MLAQWALALWLTGPPSIALVIDHSASMGIADRYDDPAVAARLNERLIANGLTEPKRLNIAKLLLKDDNGRLLRELADRYRLAVYAAAGNVERLSESSSSTDLARAVRFTNGRWSGQPGDAYRRCPAARASMIFAARRRRP